jgi:hypothetical protein
VISSCSIGLLWLPGGTLLSFAGKPRMVQPN